MSFNVATDPTGDIAEWNIIQATKGCLAVVRSEADPAAKAIACCWLLHLVGDLHQPLHASTLVGDRFPNGDRGGNEIPTRQAGNLHVIWDGLLSSGTTPAALREWPGLWRVDTSEDVVAWARESHQIAKKFAYPPLLIGAVQARGELRPINLPEYYLQAAGEVARARVVAAGLRLAKLLANLNP